MKAAGLTVDSSSGGSENLAPKRKSPSVPAKRKAAATPVVKKAAPVPAEHKPAKSPAVRKKAEVPVERQAAKSPTVRKTAAPPVKRQEAQPPVVRATAPPPVPRQPAQPPGPASTDALRAYLSEVRQFKLLSREEEDRLVAEYKADGDPEAAQKLITANLRLVVKIAMEFQSHWLNNLLDLIQEGNVGLMQALKKFDPGKGVKFSYYASYWIKAYILKYIMDNWRMVKVGTTQAQRKLFYNLRKERDKILKEGLEPAPKLLAERLGVQESEVEEMDMRLSAGREVSLDAPINSDSEQSQISLLPSESPGAESQLEARQLRELLQDKLALFRETLSPREKIILEKRLLAESPVTLQEIGEEFGISRERVRQLEERLRKTMVGFLRKEMPDLDENGEIM
ncbi:RNA polymerase subunit sigma-70 [Deltaproteobacteria bacterium Smac51]|nr:RNA polymerase subunit sigma-70 [Deltaproteobacteria bacterium Smac51]